MTRYVIGSDETGYGAWAGPLVVVAAACPVGIVPSGLFSDKRQRLIESKCLKQIAMPRRLSLFDSVLTTCRARWELVVFSPQEVDEEGALTCLLEGHRQAVASVRRKLEALGEEWADTVVDGNLEIGLPQVRCLPEADFHIPAVASASILAKMLRDDMVGSLPVDASYGFASNAGYGSETHLAAIRKLGRTPFHRRSFKIRALQESAP